LRFRNATDNQPDTNPNEEQRPGKFEQAAVKDIKLPQQEKKTESDQNDCANRFLAPPEKRVNDVGPGHGA
jgi:hypothetical protein